MRPLAAVSALLITCSTFWACSETNNYFLQADAGDEAAATDVANDGESDARDDIVGEDSGADASDSAHDADAAADTDADAAPGADADAAADADADAAPGADADAAPGADADAAPVDMFTDAGPFVLGMTGVGAPAKAANPAHNGDASGKNCIVNGCHLDARPFAFGGTLYTDAIGTARVPNAEIRVTGPDNTEWARTYSDVDGNFWIDSPATPMPANSRVGVRTATKTKIMTMPIGTAQAGCSQAGTCHGGGAGRVFLN
jgi:hypothetical protein